MTTVASGVTVVRGRIGYAQVRRRFAGDLIDYRSARAPRPSGIRAQLGARLALLLTTVAGVVAVDRRAVVTGEGFAATRRIIRTGWVAMGVIIAALLTVLAAPVGVAAYAAGAGFWLSVLLATAAGWMVMMWAFWVVVPSEEKDDLGKGVGTMWRRRCWVDVQLFVIPQARNQGVARILGQALAAELPAGEQAVMRVESSDLMATYRGWWPDAEQIGLHHLRIQGR